MSIVAARSHNLNFDKPLNILSDVCNQLMNIVTARSPPLKFDDTFSPPRIAVMDFVANFTLTI